MRIALFLVVGIIAGATLGGFCGWAINARFWGVIQDPENFWAWATIIGGIAGAIFALTLHAYSRPSLNP